MNFYEQGINFECKGCGNCCSISGFVFIFPRDMERLIERSGYSEKELRKRFLSTVDGYTVFRDRGDGACIFYDAWEKKCMIYKARPTQCRTYPFWKTLLKSKKDWKEGTEFCEGTGRGKLYSPEEIEEIKNKL